MFINEVSSANSSGLADEEGAFNDWIEFYNSGSTPVNLNNYILLREESKNNQWKFPAVIVQPNSYLTVFASGKDHKPVINHWETAAAANDIWKYKPGTSEPDSNWREINYNDNGWLQGKGGIGYGDGDDSTIISPTGSLYMRKQFQIADTAKVSLAILSMDYDDAFVAYLNGIEIARGNIGKKGDHPLFNTPATLNHEAQLYQGNNAEIFALRNTDLEQILQPGINVLAIQFHNVDTASDDLTAIANLRLAISDDVVTNPIYSSTLSGLHTDFNLANS